MNIINDRPKRCMLERIFAMLCHMIKHDVESLYGDIHKYLPWGIKYIHYLENNISNKDIIKVWTGR